MPSLYREEFKSFPEMYEVDTLLRLGFKDTSWHNNAAPSFLSPDKVHLIWIEHPDPALREMPFRFAIDEVHEEDGCIEHDKTVFTSQSWSEVLAWLDKEREAGQDPDKVWHFFHAHFAIRNPTMSECGRFPMSPADYGFDDISTGGGCTAWWRQLNSKVYMMITDDGGCSHEYEKRITVGVYSVETGDQICSYMMDVGDPDMVPDTFYDGSPT